MAGAGQREPEHVNRSAVRSQGLGNARDIDYAGGAPADPRLRDDGDFCVLINRLVGFEGFSQ